MQMPGSKNIASWFVLTEEILKYLKSWLASQEEIFNLF